MPSEAPGTYIGAYARCRDPEGRLLLVRMARGLDEGRWTLPGGGIEWGEHPDAAVVRELEEETGISDIGRFKVAACYSRTYKRTAKRPYPPVHHIAIIYEITPASLDLSFEQDGSTDRCGWFTEAEARALPLVPLAQFAVNLTWPKP
ncbi:MAG: NUDIX domain-containing protein [Spirochaetaceae bacterium]|nr:NUDIX domain-containing protein [Spirochaetaceae bacterium]